MKWCIIMVNYQFPIDDNKLNVPDKLIHGTTTTGIMSILQHNIQARGYNALGIQNPAISRDFGEGFYCSLDNDVCRSQVERRAQTKAESFNADNISPVVLDIRINRQINNDSSLKCVYFDGRLEVDGLEWAEYVAFHRVKKDKVHCVTDICSGHPDVIIGPVADGNSISNYAHSAYNGNMSLKDFYEIITQSHWFPDYKQYVFNGKAINYLEPVLKFR